MCSLRKAFLFLAITGPLINIFWLSVFFWVAYAVGILIALGFLCCFKTLVEVQFKTLKISERERRFNTIYDATLAFILAISGYFILGFAWFVITELCKMKILKITKGNCTHP